MYPPPNGLYTVFSFIAFVLCVIPLYWHLHAWNTGACLYMIWTGLGCLSQCINSIVWNKNTINRAPVYCDISTSIQVALNAAIPVCALCITRRLYKITTLKVVGITNSEKRRAVIEDLLIGVGVPILQIIAHYAISANRYDIYEDFGPFTSTAIMPPTFILFAAWPVAIGIVSVFYSVMAIYTLYKRERDFRRMVMSARGLCGGRYIRLMALSAMNILANVPLGTYLIVYDVKIGVKPWKSWADTHRHYSTVHQYPALFWKNDPILAIGPEMFRWLVVACAFELFAFIGFAKEARLHYSLAYAWLTGCLMRKVPPASVPPHQPGTANLTMRAAPRVDEV